MFDRQPITRKEFATTVVKGIFATTTLGAVATFGGKLISSKQSSWIKIKPVAGENYSPSFLKLCETKKFQTVEEAIRAVTDRRVTYQLIREDSPTA